VLDGSGWARPSCCAPCRGGSGGAKQTQGSRNGSIATFGVLGEGARVAPKYLCPSLFENTAQHVHGAAVEWFLERADCLIHRSLRACQATALRISSSPVTRKGCVADTVTHRARPSFLGKQGPRCHGNSDAITQYRKTATMDANQAISRSSIHMAGFRCQTGPLLLSPQQDQSYALPRCARSHAKRGVANCGKYLLSLVAHHIEQRQS
jgi:hypothetical protein